MADEPQDPLIGRTLGAYRLVEKLGQGGMALVYKAHEAALDEPLSVAAAELAGRHRLRSADAVYAAVAERHRAALVTNDHQQLERLSSIQSVLRPSQALAGGKGVENSEE